MLAQSLDALGNSLYLAKLVCEKRVQPSQDRLTIIAKAMPIAKAQPI